MTSKCGECGHRTDNLASGLCYRCADDPDQGYEADRAETQGNPGEVAPSDVPLVHPDGIWRVAVYTVHGRVQIHVQKLTALKYETEKWHSVEVVTDWSADVSMANLVEYGERSIKEWIACGANASWSSRNWMLKDRR